MNPQMLQQQMYQVQMMLSNPGLHPAMRMQAQMQLQQLQMMAVQMGLMPGAQASGLGRGGFAAQRGAPRGRGGFVPRGGGAGRGVVRQPLAGVPTGPKGAMASTPVSSATSSEMDSMGRMKRGAPEELEGAEAGKRRATSSEVTGA